MTMALQATAHPLLPHPGPTYGVRFAAEGKSIVIPTLLGIELRDARSGARRRLISLPKKFASPAAWTVSSSGDWILWGAEDGGVRLIDLSGRELLELALLPDAQKLLFAESPGLGSFVASYGADGMVDHSKRHPSYRTACNVAVSANGKIAVAAYGQAYALVWDLTSGTLRHCLGEEGSPENPTRIYRVALSPNGSYVATRDNANLVRIWDVDQAVEILRIRTREDPHADAVDRPRDMPSVVAFCGGLGALQFTPDSKSLVIADEVTVRVLDIVTSVEQSPWVGHSDTHPILGEYRGAPRIHDIRFSLDGQRALTVGVDATLRVWDVPRGEEIWAIQPDPCCIDWADLSPDGGYVVWAACPGAFLYGLSSA